MRTELEKMVNLTQGWVGLPMASKCLNYNVPSSTCTPLDLVERQQWGPFPYVTGDPFNVSQTTANGVTHTILTPVPYKSTTTDPFGLARTLQANRSAAPSACVNAASFLPAG